LSGAAALAAPRVPHSLPWRGLLIPVGRVLIVVALLAAWEWASGWVVPRMWASSPSAIWAVLSRWVGDGSLWRHLGATGLAASLGYLAGAALGVACGLALGLLPWVERVLAPFLGALYALPKVALAPLFVITLGIGLESKVVLVAATVFFLVLYGTLDGLRDADRDLATGLELMGAGRAEVVRLALLPATLPWIFTSLRLAVRYAFTAAILGELIASNEGLGYLIESSAGRFNTAGVFAAVAVLVMLSVAITEALSRTERWGLRRRDK